jgi:hypothetical protein
MDGLEDFARSSGTTSDEVLAVMSFLLVGMAGPEAWLGQQHDGAPLAKLDVLLRRRDGALCRMAGQLVARLRGLNRALTVGMADYSLDWIRLMRRGAFAGGATARFADPEDTRMARERLLKDLEQSRVDHGSLKADLRHEREAVRVETLLHPQFLLESVRCRELETALDLCHLRTALVVALKTEPGRIGSEPARDLRGLFDLMEGLATPQWEEDKKVDSARSRVIPLKAHVLLEAGEDDLALVARLLPEMAGRFLWLTTAGGVPLKPPRRPLEEAAGNCSAELMECFVKAAMEILEQRRMLAAAAFGGGSDTLDFERYGRVMDRYRRWIAHLGKLHQLDPGPVARELPGALGFGLGYLCHQSGGDAGATPLAVMAAAFRSARRLARRHCRELALHLNAEQVAQGLELAQRILGNLEEKGPLARRELVRCFSDQRWERFEPVVGTMVRLGVLLRHADGKLESGEVEISEVEDCLREALLAPDPAAAGRKKAATPKPPSQSRAQTPPKPRAGNGKKPAKKTTREIK